MNVTVIGDNDDNTLIGNRSVKQHDDEYFTGEQRWWLEFIYNMTPIVAWVLGIPGNVLSAVVWLRRHVASKSQSVIYLAALAINDLVFFGVDISLFYSRHDIAACLAWSTAVLEALLVLSFSVVSLVVIRRPLQVCWKKMGIGPPSPKLAPDY